MVHILVCGGREYEGRDAVFAALDEANAIKEITLIIHGACCAWHNKTILRGADRWAQEWAQTREVPYLGVPAKWLKLGKSAGMERNDKMAKGLNLVQVDGVIAMPGGPGTQNMIRQARAAELKIWDLTNGI